MEEGTGKRLLVVDDDPLVLATLSRGLSRAGFGVAVAGSGEEALESLEGVPPDLALLDVHMPGLSGFDVSQRLRTRHIPFVFLSAFHDEHMVDEAVTAGAFAYLVKPLDHWQVIPTLRSALRRAEDAEALEAQGERLKEALQTNRVTGAAVGVMVERHRISAREAFERLRRKSRSQRRKIGEVAQEVVDAVELINLAAADD